MDRAERDDDMTTKKIRAVIKGKVQGVFFRMETQQAARRIGVNGWVRNREDGSVEALIAGDAEKVDAMLAWCRKGPSMARVDEVEIHPTDDPEFHMDFIVRPTV
jgi:acylphosphatase